MAKVREATSMLLHSAEDGCVTWEIIARAALGYMSEDDVKGMCEANDFPCPWQDDEEEFEHDDDPEDDGQPTEAQEWADYDPDC